MAAEDTRREQFADKYVSGIITTIDILDNLYTIEFVQRVMGSDCHTVWLRHRRTHDIVRVLYDLTDVDVHDATHPQNVRREEEIRHLSVTADEWYDYELALSFGNPAFHHMILYRNSEETVVVVSVWCGDLVRPPRDSGHIVNV